MRYWLFLLLLSGCAIASSPEEDFLRSMRSLQSRVDMETLQRQWGVVLSLQEQSPGSLRNTCVGGGPVVRGRYQGPVQFPGLRVPMEVMYEGPSTACGTTSAEPRRLQISGLRSKLCITEDLLKTRGFGLPALPESGPLPYRLLQKGSDTSHVAYHFQRGERCADRAVVQSNGVAETQK